MIFQFFMQDAEYQASLLADKQKELNALRKVETQCLKKTESCEKLEGKVIKILSHRLGYNFDLVCRYS